MESILDLKRLTTQDYCGCILSGDYSVELKKRVAETIDQYRIFEETGSAAILYIAAWQGEKEKIWYERTAALTKLNDQLKLEISERKSAEEGLQQSYARLQKNLDEIVHAMSLTAEERDPYTAGHQKRTTELAVALAGEMGLCEHQIKGVQMAGLIHDMGKYRFRPRF